jgi:hypothetical protein
MAQKTDKGRILQDFQQLHAERRKLASQITTREEAAQREKDKEVVSVASHFTAESIVKGLADLQLAFDRTIEEAANTLLAESSKLEQTRRAIEIETRHLNELSNITVAANALDILIQEEKDKAWTFEEWATQQREDLAQEVAAKRQAWQKEQEEHQSAVSEYEESLRKERELDEADFGYKTERQRKIEMDEYKATRRAREREIAETEREKQKQWSEREKAIAERSQERQEYGARVEAFSQELVGAVQKARESAMQAASDEAQVKTDLFKKEIEANKRVRELEIQALEATVARQAEQVAALSAQLQEAVQRAQDLAARAISGTAHADPVTAGPTRSQDE